MINILKLYFKYIKLKFHLVFKSLGKETTWVTQV